MKIRGNGKGSFLALSTTWEEWSIQCRNGRKLLLGLSSLVCKLTILSANLRDLLSLNTITRKFLTRQELQKCCMRNVQYHYDWNKPWAIQIPRDTCNNQCLICRVSSKGNKRDKNPTITLTRQPSTRLRREDWFTPRLRSLLGWPQGVGNRGEGRRGEGHMEDYRPLLFH